MTTAFPDWLEPMAATLTQERFTGPEWIFERKFDGIRLLAFKQRRGRPAVLAQPAAAAPARRRARRSRALPVRRRDPRRRSHLGTAAASLPRLRHPVARRPRRDARCRSRSAARCCRRCRCGRRCSASSALDDAEPWERACREGWEGVIAKRRDSPYEHRRSPHWLKMKCEASQELVVGGFTDPQGSARRPRRAAGRLLRGRRLRLRRQGRHRLRHQAAARAARAARRARDRRSRRSRRRRACRACARTGCGRRSSCRSPSSSGPCTASCAIRGCSASASTRPRATSCGRQP